MRVPFAAVLSVFASFCFLGSAEASPVVDGIFKTSGTPGRMASGTNGEVWFTLAGSTDHKEFGRIDPDGTITEFDTPNGEPVTAVDVGDDKICERGGRDFRGVWMTQFGRIIRLSPKTGEITEFPGLSLVDPSDIDVTSCDIWIADREMGLVSGKPGERLPSFFGDLHAESVETRGSLVWWTDPLEKTINYFQFVETVDAPSGIISGKKVMGGTGLELSHGDNPALDLLPSPWQLAYTNPGGEVGNAGIIRSFESPFQSLSTPGSDPLGIAPGPNGNYWIANLGSDDLTQITPTGINRPGVDLPAGSKPSYLAAGKKGQLFVGLAGTDAIARITGIEPAPVVPVVRNLKVSREKGRTIARFVASEPGRVRIAVRRYPGWNVIDKIDLKVAAGRNRLDLGPALGLGVYTATATETTWKPDWKMHITGNGTRYHFKIGDAPKPPKGTISVRGRQAFLKCRIGVDTTVRIAVHQKIGMRLRLKSVLVESRQGEGKQISLGRLSRGNYVVRITRRIRLSPEGAFTSRPTVIRFRIRR